MPALSSGTGVSAEQSLQRHWNAFCFSDRYLARTVGDKMTAEIIERYISQHKTGKQTLSQLEIEL